MNDSLDKELPPNQTPDQRKLPAIRNAIMVLGDTRSSLDAGENTGVLQSTLFKLGGILAHATLLAPEPRDNKNFNLFVLNNQDGSMEFVSMRTGPYRITPASILRWSHLVETKEGSGLGRLRGRTLTFYAEASYEEGVEEVSTAKLSDSAYRTRDVSGGLYEDFRRLGPTGIGDTNYLLFSKDGTIHRKETERNPDEILDIKDVSLADFLPKEIEIPDDI